MRHAWLTTIRRDGAPRTTRVWFVELAGAFWVATSEPAWKLGDVRRDPRVTLSIEGRHGAITGTATVESIDAPEVLRAFADDYAGWDAADPVPDGPRVLLRIAPRDR